MHPPRRYAQSGFGIARMKRGQMALLAQERGARLQQVAVVGTMGDMAVAAIHLTGAQRVA